MSQKYFQIFRSKISDLRSENVDYLKKPPWKNFFFYIFAIHSSSRYEKRCQMLQRLFSLFQGSKNQLCRCIASAFVWRRRAFSWFGLSEASVVVCTGLSKIYCINESYLNSISCWDVQCTMALKVIGHVYLLKLVCCKKRHKKSKLRNWFGQFGINQSL